MNSAGLLSIACLGLAFWQSPPASAAWPTDGAAVCTVIEEQSEPAIITDGAGGAIVVWTDRRSASTDIYAQRIDSTGTVRWSSGGVPVCSAINNQVYPTAVAVPGGGSVMFWSDKRNGQLDIYAQRLDASGSPLWTPNGIPLATTSSIESLPVAISDGASPANLFDPPAGFIVAWVAGGSQLRVQHVDTDGDGLWTTPAVGGVVLSATGNPTERALTSDGLTAIGAPRGAPRGAVVAWQDNAQSGNLDIYARRIDSSGTPLWAAGGVAVCSDTSAQANPGIVNVGGANVVVAWDDERGNDQDLYAQKLDYAGNPLWPSNGVPVCTSTRIQRFPRMVVDAASGVIVAWEEGIPFAPAQIRAQRLDPSGQRMWEGDGVRLCTASGDQDDHVIVRDGSGGAIVAWVDRRDGTDDIYAQRVDADGNLVWPATGVPLSTAASNQNSVALVSDGRFGAVAAWIDGRNGNDDVYANRAYGSSLVDVQAAPASDLRLEFVSSNPSNGAVKMRLVLPEERSVTIDVFDALGRRVRSLGSSARFDAGIHAITWDGTDQSGAVAEPGVYFVRVVSRAAILTTRIVTLH